MDDEKVNNDDFEDGDDPDFAIADDGDSFQLLRREVSSIPKYSREEITQMLLDYRKDPDEEKRNRIVMANLRLVIAIASDYARRTRFPLMDLIQEGSLGLMAAVEAFDTDRGNAFSTFAVPYIKNAIRRYLSENGRMIYLPPNVQTTVRKVRQAQEALSQTLDREPTVEDITAYLGPSVSQDEVLDSLMYANDVYSFDRKKPGKDGEEDGRSEYDTVSDPSVPDPKAAAEADETFRIFKEALSLLSPREREIYVCRNGIGTEKKTLKELGEKYEVSVERVRQIEGEAEKKVRAYMKSRL